LKSPGLNVGYLLIFGYDGIYKTQIGLIETFTDEQIEIHQNLPLNEKFRLLSEWNKFLQEVQTPGEYRRMLEIKGKYPAWFIDHLASGCPGYGASIGI
jgi:hypothetical protein